MLTIRLAGEMVLLVHWSLLNCAAVTKILKKHGEPALAYSTLVQAWQYRILSPGTSMCPLCWLQAA